LIALYRYITLTNIIENDENARIILCLQYKDLTEFIGDSLKELRVQYVRVTGNVFQRQNAISTYLFNLYQYVIIIVIYRTISLIFI
jgi:hypothetical protein